MHMHAAPVALPAQKQGAKHVHKRLLPRTALLSCPLQHAPCCLVTSNTCCAGIVAVRTSCSASSASAVQRKGSGVTWLPISRTCAAGAAKVRKAKLTNLRAYSSVLLYIDTVVLLGTCC